MHTFLSHYVIHLDPAKAAMNVSKHGVAFADAQLVFDDPLQRTSQDRYEAGEERWQTLGRAGGVLLLVAHTWSDDDVIRIMSARRPTKEERRSYEQRR